MYNRYIRNDNGVYDRVPQQETVSYTHLRAHET